MLGNPSYTESHKKLDHHYKVYTYPSALNFSRSCFNLGHIMSPCGPANLLEAVILLGLGLTFSMNSL